MAHAFRRIHLIVSTINKSFDEIKQNLKNEVMSRAGPFGGGREVPQDPSRRYPHIYL
jgi:hypothetical protein